VNNVCSLSLSFKKRGPGNEVAELFSGLDFPLISLLTTRPNETRHWKGKVMQFISAPSTFFVMAFEEEFSTTR